MARIVVSDPEEGKAYQIEPEDSQFQSLIGLRIGEQFDGEEIDLSGYKLKITGGSDEEGFPMRSDVRGEGRTRSLFGGGTGYNPDREGQRRRKTVRGNRVSDNIAQINVVIEERGDKSIEQALGLAQPEKEVAEPETEPEETGKDEESTEKAKEEEKSKEKEEPEIEGSSEETDEESEQESEG